MDNIVRKELIIKDRVLKVELPEEFEGKSVEAIVRLKRDIEQEISADKIKIDTTKWKSNREETHERYAGL
jgi:hypothetical protein